MFRWTAVSQTFLYFNHTSNFFSEIQIQREKTLRKKDRLTLMQDEHEIVFYISANFMIGLQK